MKVRVRAGAVAAAIALVGLISGCGSEDDGPSQSGGKTSAGGQQTATTSGTGESDDDDDDSGECSWVSTDAVTDAAGQPMKVKAAGEAACVFEAEADDGPQFWLYATEIMIDPKEYEEGTRDTCDGPITDVEADGSAWTCENVSGPQGTIIKEKLIVTIDAKDFASDEEAFAALEKLLPEVDLD